MCIYRWIILAGLLGAIPLLGQGTVNFASTAAGVKAPISNADGQPCAGAGYRAQLWAVVDSTLQPIGNAVEFRRGGLAGYFLGGVRSIPNSEPEAGAQVQIRVWNSTFSDWKSAWKAFHSGDPSVEIGWSGMDRACSNLDATLTIESLGGIVSDPAFTRVLPAANMVNLKGFQLVRLPDPSKTASLPQPPRKPPLHA